MIDYIAYIIVKGLNKILGFVPISISLWIGRKFGSIAFFFNKKRRLIAYANLKSAFAKEKSPQELKRITKKVYQNLVQTFMEVLNLTKINRKYVDSYVEVVNIERIHNASRSDRGTILLTGHFGNWELSSLVSSVIGYPILVLAREQKLKRLNELLNRLRESNGCKVIRKGMSTKNILKALYEKNIVGILSDQDAGKNGVFVDFFGRPTSSHSGPMDIAKSTGSIILPNFIVRTRGPHHKVFLEEYIDFRDSQSADDIKDGLQKFAKLLESYVRRYPDQWLWLHKRWKSTPTRTILILNDGRRGHLNQSLAVAHQIQKARSTQGYKLDDTKIIIVDVKFNNKFSRTLLSVCSAFATWRCHGCMRCMKFCLEKTSYENLMKSYSELIISCGSSLAGVNIFMSKENNAKNIVIMKPDIAVASKKFDLLIIPKHDNPPKAKNVVETRTSPNLIDEEMLKKDGESLRKRIQIRDGNAIGLLIGGDNPEFGLTVDIINSIIDNLSKFCALFNMDLLVTTSRRTPQKIEGILKNRLKNIPQCKLLVIANEANIDEAVGGILSLSKVVIVSGESISMVSEAISSGKKVIVFPLEKKKEAKQKHELALEDLKKEGYITISRPENLASAIERVWKDERPSKVLIDRDNIFEAVRRLI